MMVAAIARACIADEGWLQFRLGLPRLLHCLLNRTEMVRYRLTRIVTRQVRNLALLPTGIERPVARLADYRQSDHQSPPCRPDTANILQLPPFHSSPPATPNPHPIPLIH